MLISDKYHRPSLDAAHLARRLIRAYDICSAIWSLFADDVTYVYVTTDSLSYARCGVLLLDVVTTLSQRKVILHSAHMKLEQGHDMFFYLVTVLLPYESFHCKLTNLCNHTGPE